VLLGLQRVKLSWQMQEDMLWFGNPRSPNKTSDNRCYLGRQAALSVSCLERVLGPRKGSEYNGYFPCQTINNLEPYLCVA